MTPQTPGALPPATVAQDFFVQNAIGELRLLAKNAHASEPGLSPNKDALAWRTLVLASMLFNHLAGWARDHVIGRNVRGLSPVRYVPGTRRERRLGPDRLWDDPGLEALGAKYRFDDPEINKRVVRELASALWRALGSDLSLTLHEAFDALLFGEATDLVRPSRKGLKGKAWQLWNLRFRAAEHVAFHNGCGKSKGEARDRVAAAYGLDESPAVPGRETLSKWEQRIRKHFDRFLIEDTLAAARNSGTLYEHLSKHCDLDEFDQDHLTHLKRHYGPAALRVDGRRYRALAPKRRR